MAQTVLSIPKHDITITETPKGLEVCQNGRCYLAREWTLSRQVYGLIRDAIKGGFTCLWTENNPKSSKKSVDYICFSRSHKDPWEFKFNKEGHEKALGESSVQLITVNKIYKDILKANCIKPDTERQSGGSHEMEVNVIKFSKILRAINQRPHPGALTAF